MLKHLARLTAHHLGATDVLQRLNEHSLRILMYHRFPPHLLKNFGEQCSYLAANYHVVPLEEATQRLLSGERTSNMAVITVDDGYADFHDIAAPVLRHHHLPATLFVTTGFINRSCWMTGDRVRYHFDHAPGGTVHVTDDHGQVRVFSTAAPHAAGELRAYLKCVPESTKRRVLAELSRDVPLPEPDATPDTYRPCTWDQLRKLMEDGVSIGAHTVTHPILSRLATVQEVEGEIAGSKVQLEQQLQRPVTLFAYPNGMREDFNGASLDCVRAHFAAAVTAMRGLNVPGVDRHQLLRLPCEPGDSIPGFARMLAGPLQKRWTDRPAAAASN